jgi:hypothetical protein
MTSKLDDDGWPVTTQEPFDLVTEQGLQPGPALLSCTGSDIQLAKGATAKPNPSKQKGRYIIMLPGWISFRSAKEKPEDSSNTEKAGHSYPTTGDLLETVNGTRQEEESKTKVPEIHYLDEVTTDESKPIPCLLGRIQGLSTDHPVLTIPYPNGVFLTFRGRKIESSSRFMMLCFNKRGKITCKDATSTVIVFGNPTFTGPAPYVDPAGDISSMSLQHYGGSARAEEGKLVKLQNKTTKRPRVHVSMGSSSISLKAPSPARKKPSPNVVVLESDHSESYDSDAYLEDEGNFLSQASEASRRSSRRSKPANVSYKELTGADDDEEEYVEDDKEEDIEEGSENEKPRGKKLSFLKSSKYKAISPKSKKTLLFKRQTVSRKPGSKLQGVAVHDDSVEIVEKGKKSSGGKKQTATENGPSSGKNNELKGKAAGACCKDDVISIIDDEDAEVTKKLLSSPRRRRRRQHQPSALTPAKRVQDSSISTSDDIFNFDFKDDDRATMPTPEKRIKL